MAQTATGSATATTLTEGTNRLGRPCRRLWVRCDAASAVSIRVRVLNNAAGDGVHDATDYRILAAGEEQIYDASVENKINALYVWTGSGTGTFSFEATGT